MNNTTRKSVALTPEVHKLLLKETKKLWAPNPKTLASRALILALTDKRNYEILKQEFQED